MQNKLTDAQKQVYAERLMDQARAYLNSIQPLSGIKADYYMERAIMTDNNIDHALEQVEYLFNNQYYGYSRNAKLFHNKKGSEKSTSILDIDAFYTLKDCLIGWLNRLNKTTVPSGAYNFLGRQGLYTIIDTTKGLMPISTTHDFSDAYFRSMLPFIMRWRGQQTASSQRARRDSFKLELAYLFMPFVTCHAGKIDKVIYRVNTPKRGDFGSPIKRNTYIGYQVSTYVFRYFYLVYFGLLHDVIVTEEEAEHCTSYATNKIRSLPAYKLELDLIVTRKLINKMLRDKKKMIPELIEKNEPNIIIDKSKESPQDNIHSPSIIQNPFPEGTREWELTEELRASQNRHAQERADMSPIYRAEDMASPTFTTTVSESSG